MMLNLIRISATNYYFRIYQYQTNTGGVNVYHQPGSNVSVIDNT